MVRFALVAMLVGCVGSASHAPAWPKQHDSEADGGESLAPRAAAAAVMAASTDDVKPIIPAVVAPAAAATPAATPTAATAVTAPADETIQTEEIIIEIDE